MRRASRMQALVVSEISNRGICGGSEGSENFGTSSCLALGVSGEVVNEARKPAGGCFLTTHQKSRDKSREKRLTWPTMNKDHIMAVVLISRFWAFEHGCHNIIPRFGALGLEQCHKLVNKGPSESTKRWARSLKLTVVFALSPIRPKRLREREMKASKGIFKFKLSRITVESFFQILPLAIRMLESPRNR